MSEAWVDDYIWKGGRWVPVMFVPVPSTYMVVKEGKRDTHLVTSWQDEP